VEPAETLRLGGPERTVYRLTTSGREELSEWLCDGVHGEHVRDTFFVKLMVAMATAEAEPLDLVHVQRKTLYRDLHALTARRAEIDRRTHLARAMLLDKAVMHLEADLHWLDMVETRLAELERQPLPVPAPRRRGRPPKPESDQGHSAPAPPEDNTTRAVS
jgi:DNA-binding PadR family transcriptional regulator